MVLGTMTKLKFVVNFVIVYKRTGDKALQGCDFSSIVRRFLATKEGTWDANYTFRFHGIFKCKFYRLDAFQINKLSDVFSPQKAS